MLYSLHTPSMQREKVYSYGKHSLQEALRGVPSAVSKVFLSETAREESLLQTLKRHNISVSPLKDQRGVPEDAAHQGVIALIDPTKILITLPELLNKLDVTKKPSLVLLDELQDPHNVGAIIRSAAAFGCSGILIPERNQAQLTGAVIKVSAGMAFRIPIVSIGNVNQALRVLKDAGFWTYGLAMHGTPLSQERFDAPAVFIVGNEGEGIRTKTLELCDVRLSIPMHARTESLNAAASAAIVLYGWSCQHPEALTQ